LDRIVGNVTQNLQLDPQLNAVKSTTDAELDAMIAAFGRG